MSGDPIQVTKTILSTAALALAMVPVPKAQAFAAPLGSLGRTIEKVAKRLKRGKDAGAIRAVHNWVDGLGDTIVSVVDGAEDAVPSNVRDAFGEVLVWGVSLAVGVEYVGPEVYEGQKDSVGPIIGHLGGVGHLISPTLPK